MAFDPNQTAEETALDAGLNAQTPITKQGLSGSIKAALIATGIFGSGGLAYLGTQLTSVQTQVATIGAANTDASKLSGVLSGATVPYANVTSRPTIPSVSTLGTSGNLSDAIGTLGSARLPSFGSGDVSCATAGGACTIGSGAVTAGKMGIGAAVGNIGYNPLNKSGDTMTGSLTSSQSGGGLGAAFVAQSVAPYYAMNTLGAPTDSKLWNFGATSNSLNICAVNDAGNTSSCGLNIIRGGTVGPTGPAGWPANAVLPAAAPSLITMPMLQVTGTSPFPVNFSGATQYNGLTSAFVSTQANAAEVAGYFSIVSTVGQNSINYKGGIVSIAQVLSGGGAGFGANLVCSLASGGLSNSATARCTGLETDLNNNDANRAGSVWSAGGTNFAVNTLISGAGKYTSNTALEITSGNNGSPNTNPLWEVGLRFSQPNVATPSISAASIQDEGGAGTSYNDLGRHTVGVGLNGTYTNGAALILAGAYSGTAKPLIFPSGYINAAGTIAAPNIALTGLSTTPPSGTKAANLCIDTGNNAYKC